MRREKTYLNKLNLALVQVGRSKVGLRHCVLKYVSYRSADPEAGVATQLANVHP